MNSDKRHAASSQSQREEYFVTARNIGELEEVKREIHRYENMPRNTAQDDIHVLSKLEPLRQRHSELITNLGGEDPLAEPNWNDDDGDTEKSTAPTVEAVTPPPVAHVVPATAAPVTITKHSTNTRRDSLTPVIELAQSMCLNPKDSAEVWAALLVLAEKKVAPLIGATEEGLQYLKDGGVAIFKRKSLGQRVTRKAR